jgi:hypothetical protein
MKGKSILTFTVLLAVFGMAMAQDQLKLSVTAEKTEFLLGEPVIVYVTLINTGNEPIQVSSEFAPEKDMYSYFITDPGDSTKRFGPVFVEEPDEIKTLAKNESVGGSARIFYGGSGYFFPKPGEYTIVVHYQNIESPPFKVKVLEPRDEAEKEQASLILDHLEVGLFLMLEGGDELIDALARINTLIEKYPNSLLTSYVQYAVAKNHSVPARNFVSKKPREADLPRAIEILQSIKDKEIQLYYQGKVFTTLSTCLDKTGRKEEAKTVLQEFQKKLEEKKNLRQYFIDQIEADLQKLQ